MDFTIRRARRSDATDVSALIRRLGIFKRLDDEDPEVTASRVAAHMALCLSDDSHTVLVAHDLDGTLIGYLSVHWLPYLILAGPEGYVSELFVDVEHRARGVGSELLDATISEARQRGCARLMLLAVRNRESYRSGFYHHRGWVERADMAGMAFEL